MISESKLEEKNIILSANNVQINIELRNAITDELGSHIQAHMNFSSTDDSNIDADTIATIIKQYKSELKKLEDAIKQFDQSKEKWKGDIGSHIKFVFSEIKNIAKERDQIENMIKGIHVMHVLSYYDNKIAARTTIELDGDIVTIISPDLKNNKKLLMDLHSCNVQYANYVFQQKVGRLFLYLQRLIGLAKVIITPIYFGSFVYVHVQYLSDADLVPTILSILHIIGGPALMWRFAVPRVLRYIIRKKILGFLE